jgi:hypothetical protein
MTTVGEYECSLLLAVRSAGERPLGPVIYRKLVKKCTLGPSYIPETGQKVYPVRPGRGQKWSRRATNVGAGTTYAPKRSKKCRVALLAQRVGTGQAE